MASLSGGGGGGKNALSQFVLQNQEPITDGLLTEPGILAVT